MKFLERMFGVVNYKRMEDALDAIIAEGETERNNIRKESLEAMAKLNPKVDGESIQELLIEMNAKITNSYEREVYLRKFISRLK